MRIVVFTTDGGRDVYDPAQPEFDHVTNTLLVDRFGGALPRTYTKDQWVKAVVHLGWEEDDRM